MTLLHELKDRLATFTTTRTLLAGELEKNTAKLATMGNIEQDINEALTLLQVVADEAQNELKADVDGLVTMAIQSIFGDQFEFDLQIDRTLANAPYKPVVWETVGDVVTEYTPKDEMGGSMVDPIAFILRVVLRSLKIDPCRNTFWLDEPMKNMGKGELLLRAGEMLREISHDLGMQLIIITHEPELVEIADRAWHLKRVRGVTNVEIIKGQPQPKQKRRLRHVTV